jgi:ElaB/YqjD/DUF883 family membrane-anchored ribosome-binding protein
MNQDEREDRTQGDSPQEIEFEIERTRERMTNNIDALGERLSPDHLKQQAKEAIADKAHDVVNNVGDQARATGGRVVDFITENPLPVAAVGLGAIWLFGLRRGSRSALSGDRMARFAYTGPERRGPEDKTGLGRRLADRGAALGHTVPDAAAHAGERVSERMDELKDRAGRRAGAMTGRTRARARNARYRLERVLEENPLAFAAGAAAVGIALGLLLPGTEAERSVMGEARDDLRDRMSDVASRVKDAAVEAGREVQETVREEISQRAPAVKSTLREAAENVKEQIKDSAGAVAQEAKEVKRSAGRRR